MFKLDLHSEKGCGAPTWVKSLEIAYNDNGDVVIFWLDVHLDFRASHCAGLWLFNGILGGQPATSRLFIEAPEDSYVIHDYTSICHAPEHLRHSLVADF